MTEKQYNNLIEYIDAAIKDAISGPEGLRESVNKCNKLKDLHDSFFKEEETDQTIMKNYKEHISFFESLLNPDELGWAVTEEVRNEARVFLGIPRVKINRNK